MVNRNKKIKKYLIIFTIVSFFTITIGFADTSGILMNIIGNGKAVADANNYNVHFVNETVPTVGEGSARVIDDTHAELTASNLLLKNDEFIATYRVKNDSNTIGARFSILLTNSNTNYFKVTATAGKHDLKAGEETTVEIKVKLLNTVFEDEIISDIKAVLTASPIDDSEAKDTKSISVVGREENFFETSTWEEIKMDIDNDDTEKYTVGDIKTITINNKNYRLRLVNTSTESYCQNSNYSETACGFVVEFLDLPAKKGMLESTETTNALGYEPSIVRNYLNNTFYQTLPENLRNVITPTRVISGHGPNQTANAITNDYLYIPSPIEIGVNKPTQDSTNSLSKKLDLYSKNSNDDSLRIKYLNSKTNAYWTRSASLESEVAFFFINIDGKAAAPAQKPSIERGVAPMFRIGKTQN